VKFYQNVRQNRKNLYWRHYLPVYSTHSHNACVNAWQSTEMLRCYLEYKWHASYARTLGLHGTALQVAVMFYCRSVCAGAERLMSLFRLLRA